jgi:hypothetical protein
MRKFSWRYKGKNPEGITITFSGVGKAPDIYSALSFIEGMMRRKYPQIKWMHVKLVEGIGPAKYAKLGPTVRMGRAV